MAEEYNCKSRELLYNFVTISMFKVLNVRKTEMFLVYNYTYNEQQRYED